MSSGVRHLRALAVLFVWVLSCVCGARRSDGELPALRLADAFGVDIPVLENSSDLADRVAKAGFRWVRLRVLWKDVESEKGVYRFEKYAALVRELDRRRLKVVLVLGGSNSLYGGGSVAGEEARTAFGEFCAAAVRQLRGKWRLWEVWDRPNVGGEFGPLKPSEYALLLQEASRRIKEVDRGALVSSGALSGVDLEYLREAFARGLLGSVDAVAVQPMRSEPPESVLSDLSRIRELVDRFARGSKPFVWVAGWGYSSNWSGVSEDLQAWYLVRSVLVCLSEGVPLIVWHCFAWSGKDAVESGFGLVRWGNWEPKAAYNAAVHLLSVVGGATFRRRMELPKGLHGVVFDRDGKQITVLWSSGVRTRVVLVPKGKLDAYDALGRQIQLEGGQRVAVELTDRPLFLVGRVALEGVEGLFGSEYSKNASKLLTSWAEGRI